MAHCLVDLLSRLSDATAGQTKLHLPCRVLPVRGRRGLVEWLQSVGDLLRVVVGSGLGYGSHAWQRCFLFLAVLPACWEVVVGGQQSP